MPYLRKALRFRRRLQMAVAMAFLAMVGGMLWPVVREQPVFRVDTIKLQFCPDTARADVSRIVKPMLGHDVFAVRATERSFADALRKVPEVAEAKVATRSPNKVEVVIKPRTPILLARAGGDWVSVDQEGYVLRRYAKPPSGLPKVFGMGLYLDNGRARITASQVQQALVAWRAAKKLLGAEPRACEFGDGGALRLRTGSGDLIVLGQVAQLEAKFQVYRAVRSHEQRVLDYIDVSTPSAPVVKEAAPAPPVAAPGLTPTAKR